MALDVYLALKLPDPVTEWRFVEISDYLTDYTVTEEIRYPRTITAVSGKEYSSAPVRRTVINFRLKPFTDEEAFQMYLLLSQNLTAEWRFTNPYLSNETHDGVMRITTNLDAVFANYFDFKRYYKGGTITLREVNARVST